MTFNCYRIPWASQVGLNWHLDTVLLLLLVRIILRLAVLPCSESGAPRGVARPNRPPSQRETRTVRKCVRSLRCAVKRNANEVRAEQFVDIEEESRTPALIDVRSKN